MSSAAVVPVSRVDGWLQASAPVAVELVAQNVGLRQGVDALRFYFVRKAIFMNGGTIARASTAVGVHRNTICRSLRFKAMQMQPAARALAENWATWLAEQGASLDEAERVFSGALVLAARAACKDNQCQAAAVLGIHRNSVRRILARQKEVA